MLSFSSVAEAYRPDPPSPTGVNFFLTVKNINGWMSRAENVKVHSFSGADSNDMMNFLKPTLREKHFQSYSSLQCK